MTSTLECVGKINCNIIPIRMVNDAVPSDERYFSSGTARPNVEDNRFSALQVLDLLDILDWEHTLAEKVERLPHRIRNVRKLVLLEQTTGFPPLFRIRAYPIALFVSAEARAALEKNQIRGVDFQDLTDFRG
jgi:hypothetical protein